MNKHTPGPWTTKAVTYEGTQTIAIVGTRFRGKARTSNKEATDTLAANARLIAAAPFMLETLQLLEVQLSHGWAPDADMQAVMLASARAAIAKATGDDGDAPSHDE